MSAPRAGGAPAPGGAPVPEDRPTLVTVAEVTPDPIDVASLTTSVSDAGHGAVLVFLGTVRDHADGRLVAGMTYEAYEPMARTVLTEIATEAIERAGHGRIAVVHRIGDLELGEISVAIAVATPHRAEAYDASRHVIEEIKKRLPVWKHEHYTDGEDAWVDGVRLEPGAGLGGQG